MSCHCDWNEVEGRNPNPLYSCDCFLINGDAALTLHFVALAMTQIRRSEVESEITADNTIEQSELLLSGLVARREGKLRVYNRIYQEVFNQNWLENELKNLRPYSESFKFWVASGGKDESRLLPEI